MGKKEKCHVVCCGNIAFDLILDNAEKSGGISFLARPGGSVLNTAILLRRLGLRVSLIAKTGTDFLSEALLQTLRKEKLNISFVRREKNLKIGLALAQINKKGDSSYIFYKPAGKLVSFEKKQIPAKLFKNVSVFHTGSAYSYSDFTFCNTMHLMALAKKENVFISYDPNWREYRIKNKVKTRRRIRKILPYVNLLKLSETDATGITGTKTLRSALGKLPADIMVTLGEKGSFFWNGKKKQFCPSFKTKIVDTIGAGDAFTAGLLYRYSLLREETFRKETQENLRFASAVSSLVSQGKGSPGALKNLRQVTQFLASHKSTS
ncbi:MAG: carbohydrate kinase [Candidatus Omnitrophica bacterium]|nr:carbohydrate kinase [Candidatus Omnitrophota bacterium]